MCEFANKDRSERPVDTDYDLSVYWVASLDESFASSEGGSKIRLRLITCYFFVCLTRLSVIKNDTTHWLSSRNRARTVQSKIPIQGF